MSSEAPFSPGSDEQAATLRFIREFVENDEHLSDADKEKLKALGDEMEHYFTQALRIHERAFSQLGSVANIRARWQKRIISDDDPILLLMEIMSIVDARSQLSLSQLTNVVHAFAQMTHIHAQRVQRAAEEVNASRAETARYVADLVKAQALQQSLAKTLAEYGQELPALIESMGVCHRMADANTGKAKLQLMGIGAVIAIGGFLIGRLF